MKTIFILFLLAVVNIQPMLSQNYSDRYDTLKSQLIEITVSAHKVKENKRNVSQQINTINKEEIQFQNAQNTADVLANSGMMTIQKSQQGGGSTTIRGFEANRVLLIVDGVRMNNIIYRAGHLQNILTIDENILDRIDVIYGASSTIYGSDALGGTILLYTIDPKLQSESGKIITCNGYYKYSSVNNGNKVHGDFTCSKGKWSSLTSLTYSSFGDLKMGSRQNGSNPFFGARNQYVDRMDNKDVLVNNPDSLIQKFTAYKQYDFMEKILFQPSENIRHTINFQYSTSSDVPRYDRLTDRKGSNLASSEWYYGPQKRLLAGYNLNVKNLLLSQNLHIGLHFQNIEESRHQRKFNDPQRQDRTEKVSIVNLNMDVNSKIGNGVLSLGLEMEMDNLKSSADKIDIISGKTSALQTRYPNKKNQLFHSDIYGAYTVIFNDFVSYNAGFRIGYSALSSSIVETALFRLPYSSISQKNFTFSGSTGLAYNPTKFIKFSFNIATGYRVPNIDDLSKIFETAPGNLIVPNENLKPEKTVSFDFGFSLHLGKTLIWENTVFYTRLFDAIVTSSYKFNGQDSVLYEGTMSKVFANQNQQKAYLNGYSGTLKYLPFSFLSLYGNVNYTYARIISEFSEMPLDHIPPVAGKAGIRFDYKGLLTEFAILFNGKKAINDYYLNGEDNEQYAPKDGMPAWYTLNFNVSYTFHKYLTLQTGIENIMDIQYRTFASGMNAPGRNIFAGVKLRFQ